MIEVGSRYAALPDKAYHFLSRAPHGPIVCTGVTGTGPYAVYRFGFDGPDEIPEVEGFTCVGASLYLYVGHPCLIGRPYDPNELTTEDLATAMNFSMSLKEAFKEGRWSEDIKNGAVFGSPEAQDV